MRGFVKMMMMLCIGVKQAVFNTRSCSPVVNGNDIAPALGGVQDSVSRGLTFTESTLPSDNYEADLTYNSAYILYVPMLHARCLRRVRQSGTHETRYRGR